MCIKKEVVKRRGNWTAFGQWWYHVESRAELKVNGEFSKIQIFTFKDWIFDVTIDQKLEKLLNE